ncbi:hypothetical protein [Ruegeria sp. HKCCD8929]|uniref:hypothetical protein n=1 Tax=Ruegeria sp. HKCCD8929 TaxID=2683006 RepID=UPI0014890AE0|nr:hypothetical protein [Ruegeria sp. HKCCD8929]
MAPVSHDWLVRHDHDKGAVSVWAISTPSNDRFDDTRCIAAVDVPQPLRDAASAKPET